jgi:hypothetical protein
VGDENFRSLSSYKKFIERLHQTWESFLESRSKLLDPLKYQPVPEKVSEEIIRNLLTKVLDWEEADLQWQMQYADLVLTRNRNKYLVAELKRPSYLKRSLSSNQEALNQVRGYADQQKIHSVAISDGSVFYAADIVSGGLSHRMFVDLSSRMPPESLWWISVHGVYRKSQFVKEFSFDEEGSPPTVKGGPMVPSSLLHPKYKIPAECFAYVGDANKTSTWKLPYRTEQLEIDSKRLPKAIQALLSNYRGSGVNGIPLSDVPEVLVRLAKAARRTGKITQDGTVSAEVYGQLFQFLRQQDRLGDVFND